MKNNFSKFIEWIAYGAITYFLLEINGNIKEMTKSVNDLNIKMATQIQESGNQKKAIEDHENRIRILEQKK